MTNMVLARWHAAERRDALAAHLIAEWMLVVGGMAVAGFVV